jgi:K+-sensing histidine kinase KdpD
VTTTTRPWWLLPSGRIHPLWWVALGAVMLWIDYLTFESTNFPVFYVLPVILAAWYSGMWPALGLAIAVPVFRLMFLVLPQSSPGQMASVALATALRGVVIGFLALWFARLAEFERSLQRRVKILEGMLPICAYCKNIRNDTGDWERMEAYISRRSEAEFSHGICPSCSEKHYPGML